MKEFIVPQTEISLEATKSTIERGNKKFVLFASYGALVTPHTGVLYKRTEKDFKKIGIDIAASDLESYFLGLYMMPNMELNFQKQASAHNKEEGKATINFKFASRALIGIYALPTVSLKKGSQLMMSEGCQRSFAPDYAQNHYVLWSNVATNKLDNIPNETRPNPDWFTGESNQYFIFVAGQNFISPHKIYPSSDYLGDIIDSYNWAQQEGYEIDNDYINSIQIKGTKI